MIDPSPDSGAAASRGGASWRNLFSVLTSPSEGFAAIAARPTFVLAFVLLVVLGVSAVSIAMSKVTVQDFLASIEATGREVPPKISEDPERFVSMMRWTQTATSAILGPAMYAALAGIFLVIFRLLGSDIGFRKSLATTVHGLLPFGIAAIAGIAIALGKDQVLLQDIQSGGLVPSHLGVFAGEETGKVMRVLLGSVDLFSAWCVALLATGYRTVARVSRGAAWGVVCGVWLIAILLKLLLVTAFS
jgi:CBS domain containing-hemolysin-like protein